ncbi:MAG: hypothetical protein COA43_06090 [Robiginitomaculum sp.]|nr:MAG: hypothetical protein COA43_06090 [Robiginitomaculum sp.]
MILNGIVKVLKGEDDWREEFDLSAPALPKSFIAILLCTPLFMLVTMSVIKYNDNSGDAPFLAILIILGLMSFSFPLIAYVLCMVFDLQAKFRPWVIVRNWSFLVIVGLITIAFSLNLLDLMPFSVAYNIGLTLYLSTLALDIRLAMRIANFDWIGAVFTAILISATCIMILSLGLNQAL